MRAEDELAIQRLVAIYSDAVTCRDPAAAAAVFAEHGVLRAFGGPEVVGRAAIEAALSARLGRRPDEEGVGFSIQLTRFVAADLDGDGATGRSHYFELSRAPDPQAPGRLSTGINEDHYSRDADGWRIAARRISRSYVGDIELPGKATLLEALAWPGGPSPGSRLDAS